MEKFKIKITLLASLIVTAYAFFNNISLQKTSITLIFTIIIFYILGGFIEIFLVKQIDEANAEKDEQDLAYEEDINSIENVENEEDIQEEGVDMQSTSGANM